MDCQFVLRRLNQTLFTFLLVMGTSLCHAQDFIYKHFDVQEGLPNPTIHAIHQDKDGFLWIGTESGLCRYDGTRFKNFTVKDGLPANEVLGVFQDSKERIWLSFYKSTIAYLYKGKIYNQQNDSLLKQIKLNARVINFAEDLHGNLAITNIHRLFIVDKNNTLTTIDPKQHGVVCAMMVYADKSELLVASDEKLYSFENYRFRLKRHLTNGSEISQQGLLLHKNYITWNFSDSIFLKDTSIHVGVNPRNTIKYSPVADSILSINMGDGALLFNLKDYQFTKILPGQKVSNVYMDREKNIWIGTLSAGLYKMSSQAIVNKKIGENQNDVTFVRRIGNRVFVGTNTSNMYEFTNDKFRQVVPRPDFVYSASKVIGYEEFSEKQFFIVYSNFILFCNGDKQIPLHVPRLKSISRYDQDNFLAAWGEGLGILHKDGRIRLSTISPRQAISALRTGDSVLMGTLSGLLVYRIKKDGFVLQDSLLPRSNITSIKKSADNLVWVCTTEDGLYCIGNGKIIRHFSEATGLPSNNGRALCVYNNETWFGTDKGLVKITNAAGNFYLRKYSTSDGLASDIINAIYADSNTVYLGTPQGLCYFDERMIETSSICNLVLTSVRIGDSAVNFSDKYFLKTSQRVTIEYSGISLRSEQEMTYRYVIHGIDENWRRTQLNQLEFTALPHGDYELEIVAINKFGKASQPLKINFGVMRPFYKTIWFVLLMILVPVLAILLLINRRIFRRKKKQVQKLEQEIKITQLEQMALRAQMNPHFIFNCISAIQQLVTEKDTDNASRFISSFAELVRQTLDNAPELFIPLNEEIKFLKNYFELERIRLEDRFSYTINIDGLQNKELIMLPNMVIQPFVENAIKHGIRYKKNGRGFIEVNFEEQENLLRCTITDNGVGREKAIQMRKESGINHIPQGMSITLRRIESLNAVTNQKIYVSIEDLKDAEQLACGTCVKIEFYKINDNNDKDTHN
jgi:ligand-binding sensor domain-containing protein